MGHVLQSYPKRVFANPMALFCSTCWPSKTLFLLLLRLSNVSLQKNKFQKNEMNRAILTRITRLQYKCVNPPLLENNIGKIVIFQRLKKSGNRHNNHFAFWNGVHFARWRELHAAHVCANVMRAWSADKIDQLTLIHLRLLTHVKDAKSEDSKLWIFINLLIFCSAMLRDVGMQWIFAYCTWMAKIRPALFKPLLWQKMAKTWFKLAF